jgi:hypothetical protein
LGRGFDRDEPELVRADVREREDVEPDLALDVLRDRDGEVRVATAAGYVLAPSVTRATRRRSLADVRAVPRLRTTPRPDTPRSRRNARMIGVGPS